MDVSRDSSDVTPLVEDSVPSEEDLSFNEFVTVDK